MFMANYYINSNHMFIVLKAVAVKKFIEIYLSLLPNLADNRKQKLTTAAIPLQL